MLWPLIDPVRYTFFSCVAFVVVMTLAVAPIIRIRRRTMLFASIALAIVGFIPVCSYIGSKMDEVRFGLFTFTKYSEVQDFRVERYLPPNAVDITIEKMPNGFRAHYTIQPKELKDYIDGLWNDYGQFSTVARTEFPEDAKIEWNDFKFWFRELDWPALNPTIVYRSPTEGDGGGSTYYYDQSSAIAYQHAGYW